MQTVLILLGSAVFLQAGTLINLDWNVSGAAGPSGSYSGAGVLGGGTWNNPVHARTGTAGHTDTRTGLLDSTGATTSIGVSVGSFNNAYDIGFQAGVDDSVDPLLSDYLYLASTQTSATITFSGLGAGTLWNLVLFGANANGQGSTFTVAGNAKTTSDTGAIGATPVEGDEYVRFDNITSDGSGNITVAWTKPGASGALNGFQLQKVVVSGPPNISVPATVNLTPDGTVQQVDVAVTNTSADNALDVSDVQFTGTDAAAFSLVTPSSFSVPANSNATLSFNFDPAGLSGDVSAAMAITSNDPDDSPKNVAINGYVADPIVAVFPEILDFGVFANTDPAFELSLGIYNDGWNNDLTITGPALADTSYSVPSASSFSLITPPDASIEPGGGTSATISFNPAGIAGRAVSLFNFTTNDPANPNRQVILTGVTPLAAGALSDNFNSGYATSVWDNPWDATTFANGRAEFNGADYTKRQYLRTVAADFSTIDFTVTATVHRGNWTDNGDASLFLGIGAGQRNSGFFFEPSGSDAIYLRLRSLGWTTAGNLLAEVNNGTSFTSFGLANNATGNSVAMRVSYKAATRAATFTLDVDGDGFETSDPTITATNTNLSPTDSHLFAGGAAGAWVDDVVVTLGVADPYTTWADSWSSPALSDKTPGGDPDSDGIPNLVEFILGSDPRVAGTATLPSQSTSGGNLVLSYTRNDDSKTGTTQTGQWSTDLTTWHDIAPVLVNDNGSAADSMEIRIPLTNGPGGRLFGRLHVTQP